MKINKFIVLTLAIIGFPNLAYTEESNNFILTFDDSLKQNNIFQSQSQSLVENVADRVIEPSTITHERNYGLETFDLAFSCDDRRTGNPLPGVLVQIYNLEAEIFSGGHDHDNDYIPRPTGSFEPNYYRSPDGYFKTTFTAPEISGWITATISCSYPGYNPLTLKYVIHVRYPGLEPMPDGYNYDLIGSWGMDNVTSQHEHNHFALQSTINTLVALAAEFTALYPGQSLQFNDMSLVTGGAFDIHNEWNANEFRVEKEHGSHRMGEEVDISLSNLTPVQRRVFADMATFNVDVEWHHVYTNHLHLRYY